MSRSFEFGLGATYKNGDSGETRNAIEAQRGVYDQDAQTIPAGPDPAGKVPPVEEPVQPIKRARKRGKKK